MIATDSFVEKLVEKVIALLEQNSAQPTRDVMWEEMSINEKLTDIECRLKGALLDPWLINFC